MSYTQVVFAFVLQIFVLHDTPIIYSWAGASIVFLCSVLMMLKQWLRHAKNIDLLNKQKTLHQARHTRKQEEEEEEMVAVQSRPPNEEEEDDEEHSEHASLAKQ